MNRIPLRPKTKRGFTLVEVAISVIVASFVFGMVAFLHLASTRVSKKLYAYSRTQGTMYGALDQVMYRLCMARSGSANVTISEGGHRIDFIDPNRAGTVSSFLFQKALSRILWVSR